MGTRKEVGQYARGSADLAKRLLVFRILRKHFADWRILNPQRITDFFNISAWIIDFVCFEVRIAEIIREQLSDKPSWTLPVVTFWRSPRTTALELDFLSNKHVLKRFTSYKR